MTYLLEKNVEFLSWKGEIVQNRSHQPNTTPVEQEAGSDLYSFPARKNDSLSQSSNYFAIYSFYIVFSSL